MWHSRIGTGDRIVGYYTGTMPGQNDKVSFIGFIVREPLIYRHGKKRAKSKAKKAHEFVLEQEQSSDSSDSDDADYADDSSVGESDDEWQAHGEESAVGAVKPIEVATEAEAVA